MQFKPKLFLLREQIPNVDMDKIFKYLGRWYNFEMDNAEHKASIIQLTNDILKKIYSLPLHRRNKILLYSRYFHAKFSWDLTVVDIDKTWIVNNIKNICGQFINGGLKYYHLLERCCKSPYIHRNCLEKAFVPYLDIYYFKLAN